MKVFLGWMNSLENLLKIWQFSQMPQKTQKKKTGRTKTRRNHRGRMMIMNDYFYLNFSLGYFFIQRRRSSDPEWVPDEDKEEDGDQLTESSRKVFVSFEKY